MQKEHIPIKERIVKPFTNILSFLNKHKKSTPAIIIYITLCLCLVAAIAVSVIHAKQAKEIQQAQLGKCYITHYNGYNDYCTEVYYFQENGYSHLYISYYDVGRSRPSFVSGSMAEIYRDYSVKISLFGTKTIIDSAPIELDENNQIVTYGDKKWSQISLEEAIALEKKSYALEKLVETSEGASLGPDSFSTRINEELEYVVAQATANSPNEGDYINAAKSLVSDLLKNPDSAIYNTKEVLETDPYGRAIVHLDVSAQNSFGGYVRADYYVCIQSVHGSSYTYLPSSSYVKNSYSIDFLKSANSWNEDPALAYELDAFTLREYTVEEPIEVGGFNLVPHVYKTKYITYIAYMEEKSNYTLSAELVVSKAWFDKLSSSKQAMLRKAMNSLDDSVGYTYLSADYSKSFDFETGKATEIPTFIEGWVYHARQHNGKLYFSCTNADAFSFDVSNYWAPSKDITNHVALPEAALFDKLAYSKVWTSAYNLQGFTYNLYFAFEEDGTFHVALGELEIMYAESGTYTVNSNNTLTLKLGNSEKNTSYIYAFDPNENALIVASAQGIVGYNGEKHILREDPSHDIAQMKKWASSTLSGDAWS